MKLGRSKNVILARIGRTAAETGSGAYTASSSASAAASSTTKTSSRLTAASSAESTAAHRVESNSRIGHASSSASSGEAGSAQRSVRHVVLAADSADGSVGRRRPRRSGSRRESREC